MADYDFSFMDYDAPTIKKPEEPTIPTTQLTPDNEQSMFSAIGTGIGRGLIGVGEMGMNAIAGVDEAIDRYIMAEPKDDPDNFDLKKWATKQAKNIEGFKNRFSPATEGTKGTIAGGVESAVTSLGTKIPLAVLGALAAPIGGLSIGVGAALGYLSGVPMFGAAQYSTAIQKYTKGFMDDGYDEVKARNMAETPSLIESAFEMGTETISDLLEMATLKAGKLITAPGKIMAKNTLENLLRQGTYKTALKTGATIWGAETSGEMLNAIGQLATEKVYGESRDLTEVLNSKEFWNGVNAQFGEIAVASLIFAGLGGGGHIIRNKSDATALENPGAPKDSRLAAARRVYQDISKESQEMADSFYKGAFAAIQDNTSLMFDTELGQFEDKVLSGPGNMARRMLNGMAPTEDAVVEFDARTEDEARTAVDESITAAGIAGRADDMADAIEIEGERGDQAVLAKDKVSALKQKRTNLQEMFGKTTSPTDQYRIMQEIDNLDEEIAAIPEGKPQKRGKAEAPDVDQKAREQQDKSRLRSLKGMELLQEDLQRKSTEAEQAGDSALQTQLKMERVEVEAEIKTLQKQEEYEGIFDKALGKEDAKKASTQKGVATKADRRAQKVADEILAAEEVVVKPVDIKPDTAKKSAEVFETEKAREASIKAKAVTREEAAKRGSKTAADLAKEIDTLTQPLTEDDVAPPRADKKVIAETEATAASIATETQEGTVIEREVTKDREAEDQMSATQIQEYEDSQAQGSSQEDTADYIVLKGDKIPYVRDSGYTTEEITSAMQAVSSGKKLTDKQRVVAEEMFTAQHKAYVDAYGEDKVGEKSLSLGKYYESKSRVDRTPQEKVTEKVKQEQRILDKAAHRPDGIKKYRKEVDAAAVAGAKELKKKAPVSGKVKSEGMPAKAVENERARAIAMTAEQPDKIHGKPTAKVSGTIAISQLDKTLSADTSRISQLAGQIKRRGYNPKKPIQVVVDVYGGVHVVGGRKQVEAMRRLGKRKIPADITYLAGAEQIEGAFHPDTIKYSTPEVEQPAPVVAQPAPVPTTGETAVTIRNAVAVFFKRPKASKFVTVVQSDVKLAAVLARKLGQNVTAAVMQTYKSGDRSQGAYHDGHIYLVADNITAYSVNKVLAHEGLHMLVAQEKGFKTEFAQMKQMVSAAFTAKVKTADQKAILKGRQRAIDAGVEDKYLGEETLAYYLEDSVNDNLTLKKKVILAVKKTLVKLGFTYKSLGLTGQDLASMVASQIRTKNAKAQKSVFSFSVSPRKSMAEAYDEITSKENFKKWFDGSKSVTMGNDPQTLFHASSWDIEAFDLDRGHKEGHYGGDVIYTTDSSSDASVNYAGKGPDLISKISNAAEQLSGEVGALIDTQDFDTLTEMGLTEKEISQVEKETLDHDDVSNILAERQFYGGQDNVMPLFASTQNPVRIGVENPTYLDLSSNILDEDLAEFEEEARKLVEDDFGLDENDTIDTYADEIKYKQIELARDAGYDDYSAFEDFRQAVVYAIDAYDGSGADVFTTLQNDIDLFDEVSLTQFDEVFRQQDGLYDLYDHASGEPVSPGSILVDIYERLGFDSVIMDASIFRGMKHVSCTEHTILFKNTQVKSVFNKGAWGVNEARVSFSKMSNWDTSLPGMIGKNRQWPEKASGEKLVKYLSKAIKSGAIPKAQAEEMQWNGMLEWAAEQSSVTRQQAVEYAQYNRLGVYDTTLATDPYDQTVEEDARDLFEEEFDAEHWFHHVIINRMKDTFSDLSEEERIEYDNNAQVFIASEWDKWEKYFTGEELFLGREDSWADTGYVYIERIEEQRAVEGEEESGEEDSKYGRYTLPGGKNYTELLIRIPDGQYKGAHYDQKGILAHLRMNVRTSASGLPGEDMLFLEEIQSDWHQEGKEKGYTTKQKVWRVMDEVGGVARESNSLEGAEQYAKEYDYAIDDIQEGLGFSDEMLVGSEAITPDAPFKDTWHILAMKRAIRYAVDNDLQRVAWTTGAQQADRYDLSKQVDELYWNPNDSQLYVYKDGKEVTQIRVWEEDLPANIGKDATIKLLKSPIKGGQHGLTGLDLKIGGEGMKSFYDKKVRNSTKKFIKQYGGKIEDVYADTQQFQPSFLITEQMTDSVREGMPLFSKVKLAKDLSSTKEKGVRLELINQMAMFGDTTFSVDSGTGTGIGSRAATNWENNMAADDYAKEVGRYFSDVKVNRKSIVAKLPKPDGQAISPGVRYSKTNIYSKLKEVTTSKFQGMKAQSVENFLLKQGVKKVELEATDIKEWLAAKKPTEKITQQKLLDFVEANTTELTDVILTSATRYTEADLTYMGIENRGVDFHIFDVPGNSLQLPVTSFPTEEDARIHILTSKVKDQDKTQFKEYTEPGAVEDSYREMFVTVPVKYELFTDYYNRELLESLGAFNDLPAKDKSRLISSFNEKRHVWQDGHGAYSDIKNPVVRIRFNEVTGLNEERILRIEEMQGPSDSEQKKMPSHFQDNIYQLGVKRTLAYAKENGFDGVSLATRAGMTAGETQVDRYSLEKHINRASLLASPAGSYMLVIEDKGGREIDPYKGSGKKVNPQKLEETVGKDIAKKLMTGADSVKDRPWPKNISINPAFFTLRGLDLKVGGEGLKQLYDTTLPKMFEAYGKGRMQNGVIPVTAKTPAAYPMYSKVDADYLAAVERKDTPTQQKMVDDAAKAAGYNVGPVYHGTDRSFNKFKRGWSNGHIWGDGFYFSNDKYDAEVWAERTAERSGLDPLTQEMLLQVKNPVQLEGDSSIDSVIGTFPQELKDGLAETLDPEYNQLLIDQLKGNEYIEDIEVEKISDELVVFAKTQGYDSIIGEYDGFEHTVVFTPSQIKSADPVTYDDDGKVIPLSGRFTIADDVRYSKYDTVVKDYGKSVTLSENEAFIPGAEAIIANNKLDRRIVLRHQQIGYAEIRDDGDYGTLTASHILPQHMNTNPKALAAMANDWPKGLRIDRTTPLPDNWMDLAFNRGAWADGRYIYLEKSKTLPLGKESIFDISSGVDRRLQVRAKMDSMPLDNVKYSKLPSIDPEIESSRTFAVKIFERRDEKQVQINNITKRMEVEIQRLAGATRKKNILSDATTKDTASSRELSMAMMLYRDTGGDTALAQDFLTWAGKQVLGKMTAVARMRMKEKINITKRAMQLTQKQKDFVNQEIEKQFSIIADKAIATGAINSAIDNYVRRVWTFPESDRGPEGGPGTPYSFKVFTTASKQRKLDTIYDGWKRGYELKASGIHGSFDSIATEIINIEANQAFIVEGRNTKDLGGRTLFTTKKEEGYEKLNASGFQVWVMVGSAKPGEDYGDLDAFLGDGKFEIEVDSFGQKVFLTPPNDDMAVSLFEKQPLRAPRQLAEMINKMTQGEKLFSETPTLQAVNKMNASLKGWILLSSFFHHMAGARSWFFGVDHGFKKGAWNPVKAYKAGLKKVEGQHELLMLGVRHGLTLGKMQDFDETYAREPGFISHVLTKLDMAKTLKGYEALEHKRENFAGSLFKRYFAGLKAEAFAVEFTHKLAKDPAQDQDKLAEQIAMLINEDFGGLHLQRMGRNPTLQKMGRLLLLAPDWTESNFKTFFGMADGNKLNAWINKMIGDVPPPPDMEKHYRAFWGRVAVRAITATVIMQMLTGADDPEDKWNFYKEQFGSFNQFRKLRWTQWDVTNIYQALGMEIEDNKRKTFSIVGHFADPLKLVSPDRLIKGKGSPAVKLAEAGFSGSDWAERPFTGVEELLETGKTIKKSRFQKKEELVSRLPSYVINQVISMQPIQVGYLLKWLQGEEDGLSALLSSAGAHISNAWIPDTIGDAYSEKGAAIRKDKKLDQAMRQQGKTVEAKALRKEKYGSSESLFTLTRKLSRAQAKIRRKNKALARAEVAGNTELIAVLKQDIDDIKVEFNKL